MVSPTIVIVLVVSVNVYRENECIVTFDSTHSWKLFYSKLMKLDTEEAKNEKPRKNIHQQLEEKPDEFSDDLDGENMKWF